MDEQLQVCDQHAVKLALHVQLCPAECGTALRCFIEEEQMVFVSCQHQSHPKMDLWCFTGQNKWVNGETRPRQKDSEGRQDGGGWGTAAVSQIGPVATLAKNCCCASVKEDLGFG